MNDRHREGGTCVYRDTDGVGGALHIVHERVLAPDETGAADDKYDDGDEQLRARQVILPQHGGRDAEHQHDNAVPDDARLQQFGNGFFHGRFASFPAEKI